MVRMHSCHSSTSHDGHKSKVLTQNACDIADKLERWNSTAGGDVVFSLYYAWSPKWNETFEREWNEYDQLEQQRIMSGAPRLPWQEKKEDERAYIMRARDRSYKPMSDRLWKLCPLWVHMRRYLRKPERLIHRWKSWDTVLPDWHEFMRLMSLDDSFRQTLSPAQKSSYEVLKAWWSAAYCDPKLPNAAYSYIKQLVGSPYEENPTLNKHLASATEALTSLSLYHSSCFALFLGEFHPRAWEPYTSYNTLMSLQGNRFQAGVQAVAQQFAHAALFPGPSNKAQASTYPEVFQNSTLIRDELQAAPGPYYLYNTSCMRTIVTSSLPGSPDYVCISHTWGRWRTNVDAFIAGVPWMVPENSLYDVRDLPRQLGELGFEYVWFDLFCIPQDGSHRAQLEIANQAAIFRRSKRCIAWINDVESWDTLQSALDWLALKYIRASSKLEIPDFDEKLCLASHAASGSLGSLMRIEPNMRATGEPSFWFSSLWTLQECVLCPDLELYSKGWQRLEDRRGEALPLRPLMVFIREAWDYCWLDSPIHTPFSDPNTYSRDFVSRRGRADRTDENWEDIPRAVYQTLNLCSLTRLDNVLAVGSPSSILTNANVRQSTDSRAPAIMSALGVTEWHRAGTKRKQKRKKPARLVCGLYPIEFVRETAQKYGCLFWETSNAKSSIEDITIRDVFLKRDSIGSMLPFANVHGWSSGIAGSFPSNKIDLVQHEAVLTWTPQTDGSVTIAQVGILMTSDDPINQGLVGRLDFSRKYAANDDLSRRLKEAAGSRCVYAVALYEDCHVQHGLLLQKLRYTFLGRSYLVKIGSYMIQNVSLPPSRPVKWTVL
ncbi:hypothetical protein F5B21DRAFT_246197 [Xylaria acuta]|nr:hypothetical protein F5B21DRAFT_246197 [Xylaria acuta]